jgi:hypothetical protein
MRKKQWTRLMKRERAKVKNQTSLESLIAKGDIPFNGLKGMQTALEPKIKQIFKSVKKIMRHKVRC